MQEYGKVTRMWRTDNRQTLEHKQTILSSGYFVNFSLHESVNVLYNIVRMPLHASSGRPVLNMWMNKQTGRNSRYRLIPLQEPRPGRLWSSCWIGALLALPLLSLLYLLSQLTGLPFLPANLFIGIIGALPGNVRLAGFLATSALAVVAGLNIGDALVSVGDVSVLLTFALGSALAACAYALLHRAHLIALGWRSGVVFGGLWGVLLNADALASQPTGMLVGRLTVILLCALWGGAVGWSLHRWMESPADPAGAVAAGQSVVSKRRRLLAQLIASAMALGLTGSVLGLRLARRRTLASEATVGGTPPSAGSLPPVLKAKIYPSGPYPQFPEFERPRYQPELHPIGVCFSGGGPLSLSASVGQMRGLVALGLLDRIGAISCVSGGAWFGTIFSYAPTEIGDEQLLGALVDPGDITAEELEKIDARCIAAPLTTFSTESVSAFKTALMLDFSRRADPPFSRLYSRTLNEFLLKPFGLDSLNSYFTLDQKSVDQIRADNPALNRRNFHTLRPQRPHLIVGAAQAYPLGEQQRLRAVEITPLYTGIPQAFTGEGVNGADIGGGYIDSFAFDSTPPLAFESDSYVHIARPDPPFLLSDVLGATSAAPGALLNLFGQPEWFPKFNYWPPSTDDAGATGEALYSFIDGATIDNSAIVPLLRRRYPIIVVFANTQEAIGSDSPSSVDGISHTISRLFGFNPSNPLLANRDSQVFPSHQFQPLVAGLKAAKEAGAAPWFVDSYEVIEPNAFAIPAYRVQVVWFYNDLNQRWHDQLRPEVQALLRSEDPGNSLHNFPNYDIFAQNRGPTGLPILLHLTAQQINLIAHMWSYTVTADAGDFLQGLALGDGIDAETR